MLPIRVNEFSIGQLSRPGPLPRYSFSLILLYLVLRFSLFGCDSCSLSKRTKLASAAAEYVTSQVSG